jgi:hypothetical protein
LCLGREFSCALLEGYARSKSLRSDIMQSLCAVKSEYAPGMVGGDSSLPSPGRKPKMCQAA